MYLYDKISNIIHTSTLFFIDQMSHVAHRYLLEYWQSLHNRFKEEENAPNWCLVLKI